MTQQTTQIKKEGDKNVSRSEDNSWKFPLITCSMFNEAYQTKERMMKFPLDNSRKIFQHDIKSDSTNLSSSRKERKGKKKKTSPSWDIIRRRDGKFEL